MGMLFGRENENCEKFRDALDALPVVGQAQRSAEEWRAELPVPEAEHFETCEGCRIALEEFAETRGALAELALPEPGPWFAKRVMAAIDAKEREEEATDGVWISVRRLAPRMVALSTLLLVLGGTWAMQERSRELASAGGRGGDMVFDSSATSAPPDDGLSAIIEVRP